MDGISLKSNISEDYRFSKDWDWTFYAVLVLVCTMLPFGMSSLDQYTNPLIRYFLLPVSLLVFIWFSVRKGLLKNKPVLLVLCIEIWIVISYILNAGRVSAEQMFSYFAPITLVLMCFPLAFVLPEAKRSSVFEMIVLIWTVATGAFSIFGIVRSFFNSKVLLAGRLRMLGNSNTLGTLCSIGVSVNLFLLLKKRKPLVTGILILTTLFSYVAMVLTDCRTAKLALLVPAFLFGFFLLFDALKEKKKAVRIVCGVLLGCFLCLVVFKGDGIIKNGINSARMAVGATESTEVIDENTAFSSRELDGTDHKGNTIDSRVQAFSFAVGQLKNNPDVLYRGCTPVKVWELFLKPGEGILPVAQAHTHNGYLGVFLSYGIVGILLFLVLLILDFIASVRLLFTKEKGVPAACRYLPAVLLQILMINMMDEMLYTQNYVSAACVWFMIISGFVLSISQNIRNRLKG